MVLVRAAKGTIQVAEPVRLTLEVHTKDGIDVEFPAPGTTLGVFSVRESKTNPSVPTEGGRLWTQTFEIETYRSGQAIIPSIELTLADTRSATIPLESKLATPELTVDVASSLPAGADPTQYDDIKNVVDLPREPGRMAMYLLVAFVAAVILTIAGIVLWQRRKQRLIEARRVPPHEYALQRLRALRANMPTTAEAVHAFYFDLTGIVRVYIEKRFGVMAVEQTTREFLDSARRHPALSNPAYSGLLVGFLLAGDMVKFARHLPDDGEIDQALQAAETFVMETAPAEHGEPEEAAA